MRPPKARPNPAAARAAALLLLLGLAVSAHGAPATEELLIFLQSGSETPVAEEFRRTHLPELKKTAEELGLPVRTVDIAEGVPEEVRITPLLVHQSPRGRSFFQGRYADAGKVKHFVRTSRAIPALSDDQIKHHVAVRQQGRSRVYSPIKITDLAGTVPEGYDAEAFRQRFEKAVRAGFRHFVTVDEIRLGPSDRAFYMDFYPFRSEDGRLFVSLGLFSQFSCIEPVFTAFDTPVSGPWESFEEVVGRAARLLEDKVAEQVETSAIGDGFDPVPSSAEIASWESLGLQLPERPEGSAPEQSLSSTADLPDRWRIAPSADGAPRLIFRFPSPLERYSGEVAELSGSLVLGPKNALQGAEGWIRAETESVTMGEPSLDHAVHQKMIHVSRFPVSRFDLKEVLPETEELAFGREARLYARGTFELMGLDLPIDVRGSVEPVFDDDGSPRLHVRAAFEIRLSDPFGISGPDGPEPARDTLKFFLDFLMEGDHEHQARRNVPKSSR